MIEKLLLEDKYLQKRMSMQEIATELGCSLNKVAYYMNKFSIVKRSRSEATYIKHNPNGDRFSAKDIRTLDDARLFGIGIGLYWGEGTKANKYSVRLGNTDPELLNTFIKFLIELFGVRKEDLRFGLQIFSDIEPTAAVDYWCTKLGVSDSQFYKIHVTISGSIGTYRQKSKYGVVTVYYHSKKLRDILVDMLPR